jgi:hypothetical protein
VFHELSRGDAAVEVVRAEEVVVDPVDLPRTGVAGGCGNGQLEPGNPL